MLFVEFAGFFAFVLVLGYLLPAGLFYLWFYVFRTDTKERWRIQSRRPTAEQIRREVGLSLLTVVIWAVMATGIFQLYKAGHTGIYWHFRDWPLWYLPISFAICLVLHDTYFYWTHRLMHWPRIFKYVHLGHHRSISPTPWAIYAFQPLEAVIQFTSVALIVIVVPLQPLVLLAFLSYDTLVNTAGHTGYEIVPQAASRHWLLKWFNTVTHHDDHHTNTRVNFGVFFNLWDRWMGTFQGEQSRERSIAVGKPSKLVRQSHSLTADTGQRRETAC
jgi:Delta7-sterol 5-desaturase